MKQRSTSFVQLGGNLGSSGSHRNEKSFKYSASGETQSLNAMLEMWWRHMAQRSREDCMESVAKKEPRKASDLK